MEPDAAGQGRIGEGLDVRVVGGDGAHPPGLAAAGVEGCELFLAVSASEEAKLAAANLAKDLGAKRAVVRVAVAEEVITYRRLLEQAFRVDLLLSTQLLTTTRVLNEIHGHSTMAVEYLAAGKVQLRKIHLDADSPLVQQPLRDVSLPRNSLGCGVLSG